MRSPPPRWRVLLAGLAVGLLLGLSYAWVIDPVRPLNAYPALLRSDYRQEWTRLAAQSYLVGGNLSLLRSRLSGLGYPDLKEGLSAAIAAAGLDSQAVDRALTLADLFDLPRPASLSFASAIATSGREEATQGHAHPAYRVRQRSFVCRTWPTPLFEVVVRDSNRRGIPGLRLWLVWDSGADWAITGLAPERGAGYADFEAQPGIRYALGLGEYGMPLLSNLTLRDCSESAEGEKRSGTWHIVIERGPEGEEASQPSE